jgi:hypothetical protein
VLPRPDDQPPRPDQARVRVGIPPAVGADLVSPEAGIRFGPRGMEGAAVPETTINEHRNPSPAKDDVGPAW